jgi:hypothetical protein
MKIADSKNSHMFIISHEPRVYNGKTKVQPVQSAFLLNAVSSVGAGIKSRRFPTVGYKTGGYRTGYTGLSKKAEHTLSLNSLQEGRQTGPQAFMTMSTSAVMRQMMLAQMVHVKTFPLIFPKNARIFAVQVTSVGTKDSCGVRINKSISKRMLVVPVISCPPALSAMTSNGTISVKRTLEQPAVPVGVIIKSLMTPGPATRRSTNVTAGSGKTTVNSSFSREICWRQASKTLFARIQIFAFRLPYVILLLHAINDTLPIKKLLQYTRACRTM